MTIPTTDSGRLAGQELRGRIQPTVQIVAHIIGTGPAGYSPKAVVERISGGATITITDNWGTTTATVYDGESKPVASAHYENVVAEDTSLFGYLKIKALDWGTPWSVRCKITSFVPGVSGSEQLADIHLSSVRDMYGSYNIRNTVYDTAFVGVDSHIIKYCTEEEFKADGSVFLGLSLEDTDYEHDLTKGRDVTVLVLEATNCVVETPEQIEPLYLSDYVAFTFRKNGEFTDIITGYLSPVAFSGSYNDLTDKPKLLDVTVLEDSDTLVLFKQ